MLERFQRLEEIKKSSLVKSSQFSDQALASMSNKTLGNYKEILIFIFHGTHFHSFLHLNISSCGKVLKSKNDLIIRLIVIIRCNMYYNSSARFLFSVQKKKKKVICVGRRGFPPSRGNSKTNSNNSQLVQNHLIASPNSVSFPCFSETSFSRNDREEPNKHKGLVLAT